MELNFLWPMIVTNSAPDLRTLPVGLQAFTTEARREFRLDGGVDPGNLANGDYLLLLQAIIQRYFVPAEV